MKTKKLNTTKLLTYIFYTWLTIVAFLSLYNFGSIDAPKESDKVVHFMMYFISSIVSYFYFSKFIKNKKLVTLASVAFACFYGILMECMQYFLPYRSFSIDDIAANCLGAVILGIIVIPKKRLTINGQSI
jgi:VanZ family protein